MSDRLVFNTAMNKLPKAIGLGFGMALASGAMLSPAEAQPTRTESVQTSEYNVESSNRLNEYVEPLALLALSGIASFQTGKKSFKFIKEKWFDTDSDPYLISESVSNDGLPKYNAMSDGLELIANDYRTMKRVSTLELDAEWIAFQAARTDEL